MNKQTIIKTLDIVWQVISLALVLNFVVLSWDYKSVIRAATLNAGTNFTVCATTAVQPFYTTHATPSVTVSWTFTSPAGNTQASYRVQIDDDAAFGSVNVDSGVVAGAATSYTYTGSSLAFGTFYYWRLYVTDNNSSVTDWVAGDAFQTNKPSIYLKGIILKGGVKLK